MSYGIPGTHGCGHTEVSTLAQLCKIYLQTFQLKLDKKEKSEVSSMMDGSESESCSEMSNQASEAEQIIVIHQREIESV